MSLEYLQALAALRRPQPARLVAAGRDQPVTLRVEANLRMGNNNVNAPVIRASVLS